MKKPKINKTRNLSVLALGEMGRKAGAHITSRKKKRQVAKREIRKELSFG